MSAWNIIRKPWKLLLFGPTATISGTHSFFLILAWLSTIFILLLSCVEWYWRKSVYLCTVYTHELLLQEEMMGIKGNIEPIQNWTWKLEPWTLRKNYSSEMSDCFFKREYFQKNLELQWSFPVSGKCLD